MIPLPFDLSDPGVRVFFFAVSLVLLTVAIRYILIWNSARSWRRIPATFKRLEWNAGSRDREQPASARVEYDFLVDESSYSGSSLRLSDLAVPSLLMISGAAGARRVFLSIRSGSVTHVFCDPRNPHRSCVDRSFDRRLLAILLLFAGVFFALPFLSDFIK